MDETVYSHPRIDRRRIREFEARSNGKGIAHLLGHLAALVGTGYLLAIAPGSLWALPATVLHGFVLIFLFAPAHEAIHRTAFKSRSLNDAVAWATGLLLALPPSYFRYFHFAHHRCTQDPARDPELALSKPTTIGGWLLAVSGWHYWRAQLGGLVLHARGRVPEPFIPPRGRAEIVAEARLVLAVYAAVAVVSFIAGSWVAVTFWVLPAVAGQPFLRLYLLAEHTGCALSPDMLANSRTTLSNPFVRFFAWNMPYHAEHHAYPSVPFHALPDVHRLLKPDLKVVARGYWAVQREILAALHRAPRTSPRA
jgi:fatty acid desaturase